MVTCKGCVYFVRGRYIRDGNIELDGGVFACSIGSAGQSTGSVYTATDATKPHDITCKANFTHVLTTSLGHHVIGSGLTGCGLWDTYNKKFKIVGLFPSEIKNMRMSVNKISAESLTSRARS